VRDHDLTAVGLPDAAVDVAAFAVSLLALGVGAAAGPPAAVRGRTRVLGPPP